MKKVIFIIGPSAVGKMSVGKEISKLTGIPLMHNHLTIEPVVQIFGKYKADIIEQLREVLIHEIAKSDLPGVIMTFVIYFDRITDILYLENIMEQIEELTEAEFYFAELECDLETRLKRNKSEQRLAEKPSKRDINMSTELLMGDERHRMSSLDGEVTWKNHIKINNTSISAEDTARMIIDKFKL